MIRKKLYLVIKLLVLGIPAVLFFQNCGHNFDVDQVDIPPCTELTCGSTLNNKEFYSNVSEKAFERGRSNSALRNR